MSSFARLLHRSFASELPEAPAPPPRWVGELHDALQKAGRAQARAEADLATVVATSDPIGAGFTMSQADLATALGLPQADVSILVRAFDLFRDEESAVVVRQGKRRMLVNYHPRAIDRFLRLVGTPPDRPLRPEQVSALERVRSRLALRGSP